MPISLLYFGRKPRLNGRPIPAHSSHIQIYVSHLEFYDQPAANPVRPRLSEERAKPPRASDSAAARKIFPIDSGHRRRRRGDLWPDSKLNLTRNFKVNGTRTYPRNATCYVVRQMFPRLRRSEACVGLLRQIQRTMTCFCQCNDDTDGCETARLRGERESEERATTASSENKETVVVRVRKKKLLLRRSLCGCRRLRWSVTIFPPLSRFPSSFLSLPLSLPFH